MNELIKVNYESSDRPTISARELHEFLEVGTHFKDWFPRMCEYGFTENADYTLLIFEHPQNKQETTDYQMTLDMAKEICMLQRNEKGKQARQYFIELEKKWNSPEMVMTRALQFADIKLKQLTGQLEEMKPKADYFDALVSRNLLTCFRDTAKEFKISETEFISFLKEKGYIYKDKKNKLVPYAEKNKGLFEVKECQNGKWSGIQTMITPRGRETFRLLLGDRK